MSEEIESDFENLDLQEKKKEKKQKKKKVGRVLPAPNPELNLYSCDYMAIEKRYPTLFAERLIQKIKQFKELESSPEFQTFLSTSKLAKELHNTFKLNFVRLFMTRGIEFLFSKSLSLLWGELRLDFACKDAELLALVRHYKPILYFLRLHAPIDFSEPSFTWFFEKIVSDQNPDLCFDRMLSLCEHALKHPVPGRRHKGPEYEARIDEGHRQEAGMLSEAEEKERYDRYFKDFDEKLDLEPKKEPKKEPVQGRKRKSPGKALPITKPSEGSIRVHNGLEFSYKIVEMCQVDSLPLSGSSKFDGVRVDKSD